MHLIPAAALPPLASLLLLLPPSEARVSKCLSPKLQKCLCDEQYVDRERMFVVNCTNAGFTHTDMLEELPEETNMLVFTGNHVNELPVNVFGDADLSSLKIIDLSNNGIRDIKGKAFHHVGSVQRLVLNHNNISIAAGTEQNFHHPRVFSNFVNLRELHLTNAFADNTGDTLADDLHDIFVNSNLTKLYKIHLEQNEIKKWHDDRVFCDLPDLHHLYLGDNNIPSLNFDVACMKKLAYLDLEYNNITKLSEEDLDRLDELSRPRRSDNLILEIGNNPFRCDFAVKCLYSWLKKTNVEVRHKEKLECQQPKNGRRYIMNLAGLAEAKHAKVSKALTVLLVILVMILLTLISAYIYLKKDSVKHRLSPIFEAVTRKVQYTTIESQEV